MNVLKILRRDGGLKKVVRESEAAVHSVCPACHEPVNFAKSLIQDLYGVETVEAREAARITVMDEERQRQGFETLTTYSIPNDASGDKGAYSVSPVLPSDIMGIYVFLSAIGG